MGNETLKRIIEENERDQRLIREACELVSPKNAEKLYEELLSEEDSAIGVFERAYDTAHSVISYDRLRLNALLKLIYLTDERKSLMSGKGQRPKSNRFVFMKDFVDEIFNDFDLVSRERILVFLMSKSGRFSCVYESEGAEISSCVLRTDDLYNILSSNRSACFLMVHSHPFGTAEPSVDDKISHVHVKKIFSEFDALLFDHIIVSAGENENVFFSLEHPERDYVNTRITDMLPKRAIPEA